MSFIGGPNTDPLNVEAIEARTREVELKAARYALEHPNDEDRGPGPLRRAVRRARTTFSRHRGSPTA